MSPRMHVPTSFDAHISDLIMGLAVPSIIFIVLILGAYAWAAWNPVSRPHLNRVSFRLLVYALIANLAYAVGMISGTKLKAGAACNGSTFFYNSCLMFAGVMFFSMALNLQLVLVHGVNGQKMEKYYILGAILLTLACNVPPYAAGALGFWELNATCWFNSPDPAVQLRWFVGTQGFWMFLMSTCEVIVFLTIVLSARVRAVISGSDMPAFPQPSITTPPLALNRKMILRIGLYPLFSCFLNITGAILDLHTVLDPSFTEVNWRLGIVDLLIYDLRPLMYATLAVADPSFLRALRALRHPELEAQFIALQSRATAGNTWLSGGIRSTVGQTFQNGDTDSGIKTPGGQSVSESMNAGSAVELTRQI
ncbi:hypothetical protein DFH08DRAFT_845836 [Mycena albidolilacea]|uniref:G-protein coupled receptors family 2 profile 2 domain-containing protein n=1 Tax=Mycena albidolilacea TaxID=1033008 RepID=A0AAD7EZX5_9AGAR|nr:hypothetical protein DFH08DRAFT_845836 [Mycena albidolilacea]